jgi:hypothetical protein
MKNTLKWGDPKLSVKLPSGEYVDVGKPIKNAPIGTVKPVDIELERRNKLDVELSTFILQTKEEREEMEKLLAREFTTSYREFRAKVWEWCEQTMRTKVKPVIKGEITRGKIKWRGLKFIWTEDGLGFIGILQHDKVLFSPSGDTYTITDFKRQIIKA